MKFAFKIIFFLGLAVLFSSSFAWAQGSIIGAGALTCEQYSKRHIYKKNEFIIWVQGYITAYNRWNPKSANISGNQDFYAMQKWLDQYCEKNPQQYFNEALTGWLQELNKSRP